MKFWASSVRWLAAWLLFLALTGCADTAGVPNPTATLPAYPLIALNPGLATSHRQLTVDGAGFPPDTDVLVRIESPSSPSSSLQVARVRSSRIGVFKLIFTVPATWADGTPITESAVTIAADPVDGSAGARARLEFVLSPGDPSVEARDVPPSVEPPTAEATLVVAGPAVATATPSPAPTETIEPPLLPTLPSPTTDEVDVDVDVDATPDADSGASPAIPAPGIPVPNTPEPIQGSIDFLLSVMQDPQGLTSAGYLSRRMQAGVLAGQTVLALLNLDGLYNSFEVQAVSRGDNNAIIVATLYYPTGAVQRTLNLIIEEGNWRVDDVR